MRPTNRWHYRQERIARCGWSALATLTLTLAAYAQGRPDIVWIHAGHGSHVNSVAFSPNGTLLATGSDGTTIKLWRVSDGAFVRTLAGHTSSVNSIAFSPDGTLLVSGSSDRTVRLWRVSDGTLARTLSGHTNWVNAGGLRLGLQGVRTIENPLLQVPPARRGTEHLARFPSRSGESSLSTFPLAKRGEPSPSTVPLAKRGNQAPARFPSRSGGNLKEGGNCKLCPRDWYQTNHHAIVRKNERE
jgi:hypothetical protein